MECQHAVKEAHSAAPIEITYRQSAIISTTRQWKDVTARNVMLKNNMINLETSCISREYLTHLCGIAGYEERRGNRRW